VSSAPLTLFSLTCGAIFALLLFLAWRHNHSSYQTQYARWDKSFICERCGTVTRPNENSVETV
jgi:hypothetical protein